MTFTPTQIEIIRRFGKKELTGLSTRCLVRIGDIIEVYSGLKYDEIIGHEVHLEDVFRLAGDKDWITFVDTTSLVIRKWRNKNSNDTIPYDPTLPLLYQDEKVLKELIEIFENLK